MVNAGFFEDCVHANEMNISKGTFWKIIILVGNIHICINLA